MFINTGSETTILFTLFKKLLIKYLSTVPQKDREVKAQQGGPKSEPQAKVHYHLRGGTKCFGQAVYAHWVIPKMGALEGLGALGDVGG